ncbi:copper amine oxidase [Hygrophoropsis aurantiaca]|uniref:Copper amine oxidase n=1 Tax=Hygrophoropsis aurantiaca TaxID=72124 RepID=A0ACB8ATP9_9AGAM|nr:copper amine oxidase [Hygrophoropsis aurantiaca]
MAPTALPATATTVHDTVSAKPTKFSHPLDPLTPDEINAVTLTVRSHTAAHTSIKAVRFITCYLLPPPKKAVLAALGIPLAPGNKPDLPTKIVRKAEVDFLDVINGGCYNGILSLDDGKWVVDTITLVPDGSEPQITVEELNACEQIVRNDPQVQALAKEVGVLPHQICADGWAIGYDERFPKSLRLQQALLFARFGEHDNLYAHPLDFVPVVDSVAEKVIHVDFPPTYKKSADGSAVLGVPTTEGPPLDEESQEASNRQRISAPRTSFDFLPDLMEKTEPNYRPRDDIKPLHVVQPEGVSFKMNGNVLEWQKWKMHIAFSHREGIAISTVTYNDDGEVRPIFYRLSVAEMVVPYGAPEFPHPRKFAFDTGEYGMGTMANELSLGCDCLGQIHYLPGAYVTHAGTAIVIKNVICIHEEDAGVLWKHTDYRPGGRAQTVRSRRLVVSMVCTLANYEYIWNYYFYQDGNVELEIRLTGILQVYAGADGEPNPHGTTVAPNVNAHLHQHLFSLRVDPILDGLYNTVVESDIVPLAAPTGSKENFAGNGFIVKDTVLKSQVADGARDFDWAAERRWRITNPARTHYSSGKAASYAIMMKGGVTPLMAKPDSWIARRGTFATKSLWVVRDEEDAKGGKMWPSGKYVPQTRDEPVDSVGRWVKEGSGSIENEDIVLYLTVGTTHVPRPEDWPVMPVEHVNVLFKPNNFFTKNPSMDVPGTKDPHSKPAFANGTSNGTNGHSNGTNGHSNGTCCSN